MAVNEIGKIYSRPWGTYKSIEIGNGFQVKIIKVNSGGRLSLQKHSRRSEHWVVVQGKMTISVGEQVNTYGVGEHIFIPIEAVHRMENFTDSEAAVIEVQIGSYLGEDDIVRLEDIYGREAE